MNEIARRTRWRPHAGRWHVSKRSRLQMVWWLFLLASSICGSAGATQERLAAVAQAPVYRAVAELVVVHVAVLENDRPVPGLQREDFRIVENGHERPISVFFGEGSAPLEIALLIDVSGSMDESSVRAATMAFLDSLRDDTCVLVVPFTDGLLPAIWGRPRDLGLRAEIAGLRVRGGTALYDAILEAFVTLQERSHTGGAFLDPVASPAGIPSVTDLFRFRPLGRALRQPDAPAPRGHCEPPRPDDVRRAIVLVTDGADNSSSTTIEDSILAAWGSGIPVFSLALENSSRFSDRPGAEPDWVRARSLRGLATLDRLVAFTGGIPLRVSLGSRSGAQDLWNGMQRLAGALRAHYVLGYVPDRDARESTALLSRHQVEVKTGSGNHEILFESEIAAGHALAVGDAVETARRGFRLLHTGAWERSLRLFDDAIALAPEVGVAHYGRAIALELLSRPGEALAAIDEAARRAPWLPDLDARRAGILLLLGDIAQARTYTARAVESGSNILALVDRMQPDVERDAPQEPGASRQGNAVGDARAERRRIGVYFRLDGPSDVISAVVVPPVIAAISRPILAAPDLFLARDLETADLELLLDVRSVKQRGPTQVSLDARLLLWNEHGHVLSQIKVELRDARSEQELEDAARRAFEEIERAIRQVR